MLRRTRREFFEDSLIAAAFAAAGGTTTSLLSNSARASANETIRHAVIGCRIRGRVHGREFAKLPGVEVAYVCDPDQNLANELAAQLESQQGKRPHVVQDLRRIYDDQAVDTVSIAAPNHWHALASIWAMQAGKDVYVEKPVSHNVVEGRRIVEFSRKLKRICQAGTQNRSRGDLRAAADYIGQGKLGEVTLARSIIYGRRNSIGGPTKCAIPDHVDFNLWLGPATEEQLRRPQLHYDWHWVWDTGNGELGNNNIHMVDICRWLLGLKGLGDSVVSIGGRLGYDDAGETPNTQMVVHTFGKQKIIQEVRGLPSEPFHHSFKAGHVIYGSDGIIAEGSLFSPDGELLKTFTGPPSENHFANFIEAVRSRNQDTLNADIDEGHQSSALCHVGNISYRLGSERNVTDLLRSTGEIGLDDTSVETLGRMIGHLQQNGVDLAKTPLIAGPLLKLQPGREQFAGNAAANSLLSREYRKPFAVPAVS